MDRRDFLRTTGTVIAGATIASNADRASVALAASVPAADSAGRIVLPINRNWRYSKKYAQGAHGKDFDDSSFDRVVIPHTNIRLPWHSFDDKDYEFVSIYRRQIGRAD